MSFKNTHFFTQMAVYIVKALFEPISVVIHFSMSHVGRDCLSVIISC